MNKGYYWEWSLQTEIPGAIYPQSRQGHTLCYSPEIHSLLMLGGRSISPTNDLYVYNISNQRWTKPKCSGNIPSPLSYHNSIFKEDGMMIVIGGLKNTDISSNQIFVLEVDKWNWRSLKCFERFLPRHHASVCIVQDKAAIFGGTQKPELQSLNDLWTLDLLNVKNQKEVKLKNWQSKGQVPSKRYGHISFSKKQRLFVTWGSLESNLDDSNIYSYSFLLQEWSIIQHAGVAALSRTFSSAIKISDSEVIIFGGQAIKDQSFPSQVFIYNIEGEIFVSPFLAFSKPQSRKHQAACRIGQGSPELFMIGGLNRKYCGMQLSNLRLKEHFNNQIWTRSKELNSTQKTALNILKRSVMTNYQEISHLEKQLREQNHESRTLEILYQTLNRKREEDIQKIQNINRQQQIEKELHLKQVKRVEWQQVQKERLIQIQRLMQELYKQKIEAEQTTIIFLVRSVNQIEGNSKKIQEFNILKNKFNQGLQQLEGALKQIDRQMRLI